MEKINPYLPPAAVSVKAQDDEASLPIELRTPDPEALLFFGLGMLCVMMVILGVLSAVAIILNPTSFSLTMLVIALVGIPAGYGVMACARVVSASVLLNSSGVVITPRRTRKYAWHEISSWQQDSTFGEVSFTTGDKRVSIANAATSPKRNETIAEVFRSLLGPPSA